MKSEKVLKVEPVYVDDIGMSTTLQNLPTITTLATLYLPFAIAFLSR